MSVGAGGSQVVGRSYVVVRAKLREPRARPEWVQRRALLETLTATRDTRLVLVDAPVGYGKSTLIAQWKALDSRPFAWVSLDAADNDPVRFWTYVVEAISSVNAEFGEGLAGHIRTPVGLRSLVLPRLLNRLADSAEPLVLVLDDYQVIRNPTCHDLLGFMLENLPSTTQLVISTRADPPLSFGKLRVERDLLEVRAADLSFTVDETALFLQTLFGRPLATELVEAIVESTEGWPAGIYLAAMSIWPRGDDPAILNRFTGNTRYLADYLTGEVLQRQPRGVSQFLLRTSILDSFTAPLASFVAGATDSAKTLRELERSNLFLVPLDDRREWYRYHLLFQQLLLSELRRSEPKHIPELHRRASRWHRSHGFAGGAIHHAIEAGDIAAARDLIWINLLEYINGGRMETVKGWLSALDRKAVGSDPVLCLAAGWIGGLSGRVNEVEEWLAAAERGVFEGPLPDGTSSLDSGIALLRATFGHNGISEALEYARAAVDMEQGTRSPWRPVSLYIFGLLLRLTGSYNEAQIQLEHAYKESRSEQPVLEALTLAELSLLASDVSDRVGARRRALEALKTVEDFMLLVIPQASIVYTALGRVLVEDGDLDAGLARLDKALAIRDAYPEMSPWPTLQTLITLAPVRFALGDQQGARELVQRAAAILDFHSDAGVLGPKVRRLERSLGRPSQRPALFGVTLTDREISVLRLLSSPLTHREIGETLFISLNTVKSHVRSLYQKLTTSSREEAVRKGRELGLL